MAKKSVYKSGGPTQVEFNMTPMIDVTFQLILFFILVGQVASDALAKMMLAKPWESQALKAEIVEGGGLKRNKMIINIVSASKATEDIGPVNDPQSRQVGFYQVGPKNVGKGIEGLTRIETMIIAKMAGLSDKLKETFYIEIRADKRLPFGHVKPVLVIAGRLGVPLMNITAIRDLGK